MPSKKLFLLDAMALIYRAHFAFSKNPRINSKGLNTGAVLGFTNTLLEILNKEKPTHIGVAFDTPAPTFRHIEYEAYKAHRDAQPEDISIAIPLVKQLVKAYNIPVLELDGYEADDVIGTLAKKAARQDFEVFMMTPDKDYGQLVEEHIFLYKPAFMGNGVEVMGVPEVLEKWGIQRIDQVIDMLGLQGDSVDNIPGIPGIGPKTAQTLLEKYHTVEGLIANAHELKGKQKEKVIEFAQQGLLSKKLATIDIEVPIPFDEEQLKWDTFNQEAVKTLFEELEFRTLSRKVLGEEIKKQAPAPKAGQQTSLFGESTPAAKPAEKVTEEMPPPEPDENTAFKTIAEVPHRYHVIDTPEKRKTLLHFLLLQESICFDTETTSTNATQAELVGISFAYFAAEAYYLPIPEAKEEATALLQEFHLLWENEAIEKIGQNLKYDLTVLANYGIEVKGKLFDTMLAHYLIEPDQPHNMDFLAKTYLGYLPVSIETLIGKKGKKQGSMRDAGLAEVAEYAGEDADITLQLKKPLQAQLQANGLTQLFETLETPLAKVLTHMEGNGIRIDTEALKNYSVELQTEITEAEKLVYQQAGETFNIGSPKQLGEILFDKMKLLEKPKKTKTGQYATGEEILVTLTDKHPIIQAILDYRQLNKLKSTYVDALPLLISPKDGLIHTSYNQTVAATGRLSSTNPNLQNIPIRTDRGREIRKAFVPRSEEYVLMSADYSQIELRIMAAFSKDEHMIEAFRQKQDIHASTAAKLFKVPLSEVDSEMRRRAKTANFGIIYGISAFGLSQRLNIPRKEAAELIDAYFEQFPTVKGYMDRVIAQAREQEYVETLMGRRRYLRDINSRNQVQRGFAERNAINAPIQGSAADIIKKAMIDVFEWMKAEKLQSKMILQVHDELVFDVHRQELELMKKQIPYLMEHAVSLVVPLEVEAGVGNNWLEAH